MKKLIVLFIVLALLFVTNPSKEEYVVWLKDKSTENAGAFEKGVVSVLGNLVYKETTTASNFFFFTIFKTKITKGTSFTSIGILQNFIAFNKM